MTKIEKAAIKLHSVIWNNTGTTDEWPIQMKVDAEIHDNVVDALNGLHDAIEEYDPKLVPWPIKTKKL